MACCFELTCAVDTPRCRGGAGERSAPIKRRWERTSREDEPRGGRERADLVLLLRRALLGGERRVLEDWGVRCGCCLVSESFVGVEFLGSYWLVLSRLFLWGR